MGDSVWLGDSGAGNDSDGRGVVDDHEVVDLSYSTTQRRRYLVYFNHSKAFHT